MVDVDLVLLNNKYSIVSSKFAQDRRSTPSKKKKTDSDRQTTLIEDFIATYFFFSRDLRCCDNQPRQ